MRARLTRHVCPTRARGCDEPNAAATGDVDDVERTAGFGRQLERARDRLELRGDRTRRQVVAHRRAALGDGSRREPARELRALCVHRHGQAEGGGTCHAGEQRLVVGRREVLHPGGAHERLEAHDATSCQLVEAVDVSGNEPAPQREVDDRDARGGGDLEVERGAVERRRTRIERHVAERGRAPSREGCRSVSEPLPLRAPRVVEVDMDVHGAGEHVQTVRENRLPRRPVQVRPDCRDTSVRDADVGEYRPGGRDHDPLADEKVELAHRGPSGSGAQLGTSRHGGSIAPVPGRFTHEPCRRVTLGA